MSTVPQSKRRPRAFRAAGAGAILLALFVASACSSGSSTATGTTSAAGASAAPSSTAKSGTGDSGSAGSAAVATAKVSANNASATEIEQALTAAGVPNAARWTKEVQEYRPYPTDDASLAKLKKELQKYNPSPEVLNKILAALQP